MHLQKWLCCRPAVACSVTGVGEAIMRTTLARRLCERLQKPDQDAVRCCGDAVEEARRCCVSAGLLASDCGVIAVRALRQAGRTDQCKVHFVAATCSQSMGFGYAWVDENRGCRRNMIKRQSGQGSTSIQRHEESFMISLRHSAASSDPDRQC